MIVFRLSKGAYKNDLSGKGAERAGGRWNSKGHPMLYTASSRALCMVEVAVHLPLSILPADYWLISIEIPDDLPILEISMADLPRDWKNLPPSGSTQQIGDAFLLNREELMLKVPSVVVRGDFNFLLNPLHPEYHLVKVLDSELFEFDARLFQR